MPSMQLSIPSDQTYFQYFFLDSLPQYNGNNQFNHDCFDIYGYFYTSSFLGQISFCIHLFIYTYIELKQIELILLEKFPKG